MTRPEFNQDSAFHDYDQRRYDDESTKDELIRILLKGYLTGEMVSQLCKNREEPKSEGTFLSNLIKKTCLGGLIIMFAPVFLYCFLAALAMILGFLRALF